MILSRINIECIDVCLSMQIQENMFMNYEHSCSSVRVFFSILARLAHLAQSYFPSLKVQNPAPRLKSQPRDSNPSLNATLLVSVVLFIYKLHRIEEQGRIHGYLSRMQVVRGHI